MKRLLVMILVCLFTSMAECQAEGELTHEVMEDSNVENNDKIFSLKVNTSAILATNTTHQSRTPPIHTILKELGALEEKLAATVRALEETNKKLENAERKLSSLNSAVTQLSTLDKGQPKVAFSATSPINGEIGPANVLYPLVYRNVLSNFGGHYSPQTGYFTAPVRGVYFFTFTSFCWGRPEECGGSLYKYENRIVSWYGHSTNHPTSASNSAILMLQVGDMVNVRLWPNMRISDNGNKYSTFNGFLLFPM